MANKKNTSAEQSTQGNENILNIIAPSGLEFGKNRLYVGENFAVAFVISRYPSNVDYRWLKNLSNLEGSVTQISFETGESDSLIASYDARIKTLAGDRATAKKRSEQIDYENQIKDLEAMIREIREEPFGYMSITILVQDTSERLLEERIRRVKAKVAAAGATLRVLAFRQEQGYRSIAPYGLQEQEVENLGRRNVPLSTYLGGFPMSATGLTDPNGYYLGKTITDQRLIWLDTWVRGGDRVNGNWWIQGLSGVGKSSVIKLILLMEWATGTKIIIIDPEREFVNMAKQIGGKVVDCIGGRNGRINPLQIRESPALSEIENEEDNDGLYLDNGKGMNDMALHIQTLRAFFRLYIPEITEVQMAYLEEALIGTYNKFGITWETDIQKLNNEDFPTIKDLGTFIKDAAKDESLTKKAREAYEDLAKWLESAVRGADQFVWNGPTTLEADSDFIVLDTSGLMNSDENVKMAQYMNLCTWQWQQVARNRKERLLVGIDEGHMVIDPDIPYVIKYISRMSKRVRKYEAGLLFIAHSPSDVLDPSVRRFGEPIVDNSCYKLLMGCDGKNLQDTKELFNLTDAEEAILAGKQRGQAIFCVGSNRMGINIDIKEEYIEIMGKGGGR